MTHSAMEIANLPAVHLKDRRYQWAPNGGLLLDPQEEELEEGQTERRAFARLVPAVLAWVPGLLLQPSARLELPVSERSSSETFARRLIDHRDSFQRAEARAVPDPTVLDQSVDSPSSAGDDELQSPSVPSATENKYENREHAGLRQRRAPPDGSNKPSEPALLDPVAANRERIREALDPLFSSAPCILLCTGKEEDCKIDPIHVGESGDRVSHWRTIQQAVRKRQPRWRRYCGAPKLQWARIRIVGRHPPAEGSLTGELLPINAAHVIQNLKNDLNGCDADIIPTNNWDRGYDSTNVIERKYKKNWPAGISVRDDKPMAQATENPWPGFCERLPH
ncbi:hypothetical protein CCHR01_03828 [Colletotrichum chrysophilum]|uniref:Uncharacterized protein n=1 Tax=Colletotrichum chrysophilum TaxID=1836956 RepID=A0AAD9AS22_9PEZI|nr:hypothetical protein CCHR01_03828 [Colletotrichum chrysophilum]